MDSLSQQNSNCFICEKSILLSSASSNIHRFSLSKRFLKLASRYLNISVSTYFSVSVEPEKTLIENVDLKKSSVDAVALANLNLDCCQSCRLKVQNFCRLYDQWIQIKMGLDHISKEIAATMKACPNLKTDGIKLNDFKKGFVNQVETRQRRIYPRVELERLPVPYVDNKLSNEISDPLKHNAAPHGHSCGICGKTFSYISNLRRHQNVHLAVKPFKCTYCDSRFTENRVRIQHEMIHSGETPFKCKICGKSFKQRNQCRAHETRLHNPKKIASDEKKPYKCYICDKGFLSEYSHRRHMRCHAGEKKWACKFCGRKFFRRQTLLDHEITHTGELPFKCGFCEKFFSCRNYCRIHQRQEHLELIRIENTNVADLGDGGGANDETAPQYNYDIRIKCEQCPEMFTSALDRRRHIQQHHNTNGPNENQKRKRKRSTKKGTGRNCQDASLSSSSSPQVVCKLEYKYEIEDESGTQEEIEVDMAQIIVPSQLEVSDIVIKSERENFETHILPD